MKNSNDISNKTLATLLIVAIVVSVGGTWLVVNKAPTGLLQITGAPATDTGTATVTIETTGSVRFNVATLNFGTGKVNTSAGNTQCVLDSNGTNDSARCINFTAVFGNLTLENDGSTNVTVQLASDKAAVAFLGGDANLAYFMWSVGQNESTSCRNGTGGTGQQNIASSLGNCTATNGVGGNCTTNPLPWSNVNTTAPGTTICQELMFNNTEDSIAIEVNFTIPFNAPAGVKTATFTATATTN
jgi:hypothetical protein